MEISDLVQRLSSDRLSVSDVSDTGFKLHMKGAREAVLVFTLSLGVLNIMEPSSNLSVSYTVGEVSE